MKLIFDTHGNDKQKEACKLWADPSKREILYGGSKGSGKSYLGCMLIFGYALMYPGTFWFIARKRLTDLIRYTTPSVKQVFKAWGITESYYRFRGDYNYFELHNGSRVYYIDAKYEPSDPLYERFGSIQMTGGWIEEGGEFSLDAKNNLAASIGRWMNNEYNLPPKLLITCNPSNNFLFTQFYLPNKKGQLDAKRAFVQALPTDNKMAGEHYVENLLFTLTPTQIERLVYGNWEFDDDPMWLVDYDAVCDLFTNDFVEKGKQSLSTDLAAKGRDKWVVGHWSGLRCKIVKDTNFSLPKQMEEWLKVYTTDHIIPRSRVVADSDGLGTWLESYMTGIKEFHGGARAVNNEAYVNLRAECYYKLAELVNKRQLYIECSPEQEERICKEFGVLKAATDDPSKKKQIISKETMKELLGFSPDYLDMLMMEMIFYIKKEAAGVQPGLFKKTQV